jgi:hypothetical protein
VSELERFTSRHGTSPHVTRAPREPVGQTRGGRAPREDAVSQQTKGRREPPPREPRRSLRGASNERSEDATSAHFFLSVSPSARSSNRRLWSWSTAVASLAPIVIDCQGGIGRPFQLHVQLLGVARCNELRAHGFWCSNWVRCDVPRVVVRLFVDWVVP